MGSFDSVENGHSNIKNDKVRNQLCRFLNGLQSIPHLDDLPTLTLKKTANIVSPGTRIIGEEDTTFSSRRICFGRSIVAIQD